jgi:serine/threonine-protein kinase
MPTCSRCSSPITEADRFCSRCGAPSGGALEASAAQTVAATPSSRPVSRPPSDPSSLGHGRFEPGARLGTRYRVVGLLGRGGMGEVYRADDLELGQSVALKFLPDRLKHDPETLARFRSEVRLARQIAHPNIARVYDIGEADGNVFLTMEYVDGEDLASVLRRMGRPSRDKAIEIARQLCLGLAAAHERGVLHRDLKPSNVMIDGRGRVRIMDFGLAALADEMGAAQQQIVGTPAYMAPEQLATGQVSVQSDLYALALVIYELFTGRRVHDTTDPAELGRRHASGSIPTPSSVVEDMDPVIERVVLRCLESDPRLRPPSAYAVLGALPGGDPLAAALAAGETPSPELVANAGESGGLAPRVGLAMLAAGLVLLGASSWLSTPHFRALRQSPEALSYRAASVLQAIGYDPLPPHTAAGFAYRNEWVTRIAKRRLPADSIAVSGPGAVFFWRRFAPRQLVPTNLHESVVRLTDPPQAGAGSVAVMLTIDGRLLGLQAIARTDSLAPAPDSGAGRAAASTWTALLAQAAIDTSRLVPEAREWAAPVATDTTIAWRIADPRALGGQVHVRAGAYRGRPVYFAITDSLGSATAAVEPPSGSDEWEYSDWLNFSIWISMLVAAAVLARRNLRLGRGDRRGGFRLAAFVFVATAFETVFTWSIPENGAQGLVDSLASGRALGHGMVHAIQMWLAYVAVEPYVRRLWPRMLVSWARLASGRLRDPMVGRDVLAGLVLGAAGAVATQAGLRASAALHLPVSLGVLGPTDLAALATYGGLGFSISYNLSVMVLDVLTTLVLCLITHLFTRNDRVTFVIAGFLSTASLVTNTMNPTNPLPILEAVVGNLVLFIALFRFGLLTALACVFTGYVLSFAPPALDPAAWWSGRGMVVLALLGLMGASGFWTALAGQPIMGDPLQEKRLARST